MSRTDKDTPWWVQSDWYEPFHLSCENELRTYGREPRACDLPAEPTRSHYRVAWRKPETWHCKWEAIWPRRYRYTPPTRCKRHLEWWGPDRAMVRDLVHDARKQHRGSGEVEILRPEPGNHRHASKRGWWD